MITIFFYLLFLLYFENVYYFLYNQVYLSTLNVSTMKEIRFNANLSDNVIISKVSKIFTFLGNLIDFSLDNLNTLI